MIVSSGIKEIFRQLESQSPKIKNQFEIHQIGRRRKSHHYCIQRFECGGIHNINIRTSSSREDVADTKDTTTCIPFSKAKGEWIKLIHDDDWFSNKESLQKFADATIYGPKFIYSSYSNFIETEESYQTVHHNKTQLKRILRQPLLLLSENIIGPPSVTLFHKTVLEQYDERMKWRVDLEYYIRVLLKEKEVYHIQDNLIHVGVSESQVTNYCINVPKVEIPEGFIILEKYGTTPLKNMIVYDAWWRILRNCQIRSKKDLTQFGNTHWPMAIINMVHLQSKFSSALLKNGFISKISMTFSYLQNIIQGKL